MKIVYQPSLALPTMKAEKNKKDIKSILEMTKRKQKQKYHSVTLFDYHTIKSFQYSVSQTGFLQKSGDTGLSSNIYRKHLLCENLKNINRNSLCFV